MNKKERHGQDLIALIDIYSESGDAENIRTYIRSNSSLPGRRANLELAAAFGDVVADAVQRDAEKMWQLCNAMAEISAQEAPVNSPSEFIPFCGALGLGAVGSVASERRTGAFTTLMTLAGDPRWRMREAVCFGLQKMLVAHSEESLRMLERWATEGTFLEMRAVAAAVAEPGLLRDEEVAARALQLHKELFARVLAADDRRSEAFGTLRKALGYTLSVVVQALPLEGFEYLARLVASGDSDVLWIVKQNLKKNRLIRHFPDQVAAIRQLID